MFKNGCNSPLARVFESELSHVRIKFILDVVSIKANCSTKVENLRNKWSRGESNSRAGTVNNTRLRK